MDRLTSAHSSSTTPPAQRPSISHIHCALRPTQVALAGHAIHPSLHLLPIVRSASAESEMSQPDASAAQTPIVTGVEAHPTATIKDDEIKSEEDTESNAASGSAASGAAASAAASASGSSDPSSMLIDTDSEAQQAANAASRLQQPNGGVLLGWGSGMFGLQGRVEEEPVTVPTPLPSLSTPVTSVSVGSTHALAVASDGALYSWGDNAEGQLGLGDRQARSTPTELPSLQTKQIAASAAGYVHSLALTTRGEVFAFGSGEMAALGLTVRKRPAGTPPDLSTHALPALVKELSQLTRIVQVACGDTHSLALSSAGRVYAVGEGSRGALGLDFKHSSHVKPGQGAAATSADSGAGVRVAVFTELVSLLPIPIASIAAGAHHSLLVSASGSVYSCGDSSKGRLGYSNPSNGVQWLPRRIDGALQDKHVMSASGGSQYSLFLTQSYQVYAAGSNAHGEAGVDGVVTPFFDSPVQVPGLPPILQISAGSTHALARDHLNRVWSWGSGEMGELGRGTDAELCNSKAVGLVALPRVFPHQHVVSVAAGSNTSYAIIAQTLLVRETSRGAAASARLVAHSAAATPSSSHDAQPSPHTPATYSLYTPSFDFAGAVSSTATAASTPTAAAAAAASAASSSSDVVSLLPPQFIVPPSASPLSISAFSYSNFTSLLRKKDYTGLASYISFVFSSALILNASFMPRASVGGGSYIDHNLVELVYSKILKASLQHARLQTTLTAALQRMVSSMVTLMKQPGRQPPKDLGAYRAVFIALQSPHLLHASMSETALLADISMIITRMPREVAERVSSYLYSQIPFELFRTRFIRVLLRNLERRMQQALHGSPIQMRLRQSSEEMQDLVYILNGMHMAVERRTAAATNAALHGRHHGHGLLLDGSTGRTSPDTVPIPETAWHLSIDKYMSLDDDLAAFTTPTPTAAQLPKFSFMRFPWMLSPSTKAAYLRTEFNHVMQNQAFGAALFNLNPMLELQIRRTHIVEDTVMAINRHSVWELRRPLKVQFISQGAVEPGEDQGGLTAEFFELAMQQLFLPQYALWEAREDWRTCWFSGLPTDPSKSSLYQIFGVLLGMCVYSGSSVNLSFPLWLWAQLLGIKPTLAMLHSADPQLADSLQELLDFEGDIENVFCLSFSVDVPEYTAEEHQQLLQQAANSVAAHAVHTLPPPNAAESVAADSSAMQVDSDASDALVPAVAPATPSSSASTDQQMVPARRTRVRTVPLLPGGESIPVTQENKAQYVEAYIRWLTHDSVRESLDPLVEGFQSICGVGGAGGRGQGTVSMRLFSSRDLELVVVGQRDLNFKDLQRTCRYEGGYHADHPTVVAFWKVVHSELSPKEQRRLLLFATGSSRAPVGGLGETRLLLQRAGPDSESLPTSSTCFHAILLPEYETEAKLAHKLKIAIANAVGFGLR